MQSAQDHAALLKLAQVYRCLNDLESDDTIIERICQKEGDNNYQLQNTALIESDSENLGNTVLHLVAADFFIKPNILYNLLHTSADFTIKNQAGLTALLILIRRKIYHLPEVLQFGEDKNVYLLLGAHIEFNNFSNPCDNNGMSHFHIACMFNNIQVIEFFLKNGISIHHAVNVKSDIFAGYTPLHFAARFCSLEAVQTLLKHGANIYMKDAKEMTPLHVLIEHKMLIYDCIYVNNERQSFYSTNDLMNKIERSDRIMTVLLKKNSFNYIDFLHIMGISKLHIASTMQDSSQVESLLEKITDIYHSVPRESTIWPGYAALHFAAHCNVETVKILMMRGANIEAKDANGVTPFDICVSKQKIEDVSSILSRKLEWKYIQFTSSKIKLIDLLSAMGDVKKLGNYLRNKNIDVSIPNNAPLWPGYTPLHLAVLFSERFRYDPDQILRKARVVGRKVSIYPLIEECLNRGGQVTTQDSYGSTPLHLAFKLEKDDVVARLLEFHHIIKNPVNEDGLSHLFIACAAGNKKVVEQLANQKNVNVAYSGKVSFENIVSGYTPLHIAVANGNIDVVKILLTKGACVNMPNASGKTPIHSALFSNPETIGFELLQSQNLKECLIPGVNLSYLHVACKANNLDAVKKLIALGVNVNTAITCDKKYEYSSRYKGWTPLQFAVNNQAFEIVKVLIREGADILAKSICNYVNQKQIKEFTPFFNALDFMEEFVKEEDAFDEQRHDVDKQKEQVNFFIETIKSDDLLQKRIEKEFGITMLHLACFAVDFDAVKKLLKLGANVNAQVCKNSSVWSGCTPLHLVIKVTVLGINKKLEKNADNIVKLLLSKGADVMLFNTDKNTPIHLNFESYKTNYEEASLGYRTQMEIPGRSRIKLLLKGHTNFKENPVNRENISHFHIAVATNNLDAVMKFLEHGVDVNQATNYSTECAAGYTPLHYAVDLLSHKIFNGPPDYRMVKLLLKHGADPNKEDLCGNTPFHLATRAVAPRDDLLKLLVNHGADINKRNLHFQTPFELMLAKEET